MEGAYVILKRLQIAAIALIGFNLVGTILTWIAHLTKPGTGDANVIGGGTLFTGPLFLLALVIVALLLTRSSRPAVATVGVVLLTLFALGFTVGEVSELFQHNVGISGAKWDVVLAASVVGVVLGAATAAMGVRTLVANRKTARQPVGL
jgi:hypothetical protein